MKSLWLSVFLLVALGHGIEVSAQNPNAPYGQRQPNLMTIAEGGIVTSASANASAALALTDGSPQTYWSNEGKRDPLPYSFVFELRAPTRIAQVGVIGAGKRPGGVQGASARGFTVEASGEGATRGFRKIAAFDAAEDGETLATVTDPAAFRWLRFVIASNHGSKIWTYFNEVIVHGEQTLPSTPPAFTGIFEVGRKSFIELKQKGNALTGCYSEQAGFSVGTIRGNVDRGVARVSWTSDKGVTGAAMFAMESAGNLSGVRYRDKSRSAWGGGKAAAGSTTPCSAEKPPANPITDGLARDGRVRIYGLLFDFDQATLRPESRSTQDMLLEVLRRDTALSLVIEGHTDSEGADDYNLTLSQRRAEAVVGWLVAQGIEVGRLSAVGKGEAVPVASNTTADGRALNRRVEAIRGRP